MMQNDNAFLGACDHRFHFIVLIVILRHAMLLLLLFLEHSLLLFKKIVKASCLFDRHLQNAKRVNFLNLTVQMLKVIAEKNSCCCIDNIVNYLKTYF